MICGLNGTLVPLTMQGVFGPLTSRISCYRISGTLLDDSWGVDDNGEGFHGRTEDRKRLGHTASLPTGLSSVGGWPDRRACHLFENTLQSGKGLLEIGTEFDLIPSSPGVHGGRLGELPVLCWRQRTA